MSVEVNKTLARRFFQEIWNEGREAAIDRYIPEFAAGNDPDFGSGREGFRRQWKKWRAAFPDLHFAIDDLIGEGDKVLTRWTLTGTHQGEFMGIPATGRRVAVSGMSLDRIEDGMVVEGFDGWDALGLRRQLGAIPDDPADES
ncbi:MAG: ester cyclase [Chloroflexota bacterium]|nr:ester cyclase [Chloroflexota bacterium]